MMLMLALFTHRVLARMLSKRVQPQVCCGSRWLDWSLPVPELCDSINDQERNPLNSCQLFLKGEIPMRYALFILSHKEIA